jgi:Pyruvate/2-oxoacid:ferredoxin oxidoreductase gamma subunit
MLGAYVGASGAVPEGEVEREIEREFSGERAAFADANLSAFRRGVEAGRAAR